MPSGRPRAGRLSTALCVIGMLIMTSSTSAEQREGCQADTLSSTASPDDLWIALVSKFVCSDGGFVTTVTDVVQIVRRGENPKRADDVFALDDFGPDSRPVTKWLTPQKLQITIPHRSLIGLRKSTHKGIEITVVHVPDDAATGR